MRILIRAELDKLRTLRSSWIVLAVSVALSPAIAAVVLATSKHLHEALSQIANAAFALSAVSTGILCASVFAAEYQDRTIVTTFTLVPERRKVVLAKAAAAAIAGVLAAALSLLASYGLAGVWLWSAHVAWAWSAGNVAQAVGGDLALAAAVAIGGVGIGGLTQSPALAGTAMGLTWLGLSNLLATFVAFFRHYGIPAAANALTQPTGQHHYSFIEALGVTAGITALLLLAGLKRVQLTDIR